MTKPIKTRYVELPRREYIRLLSEYALDSKFKPSDERNILLSVELIKEHYLSGSYIHVLPGPKGQNPSPICLIEPGITVKGRLFLQKLEKEEQDESCWGKLRKHLDSSIDILIGVIIGVAIPIAVEIIRELLGLTK
jgi:hypothetical protein